jgi:EAL and modified HD-GYP domain-containing signal transduction protein
MTTEIFVARQPIFDRRQQVYAYELLFRSGLDNVFTHPDQDQASFLMLHTSLLGFGLDALIGDKLAFVNASREVLLQEFYMVLPRDRAIIELVESVEPDAEVIAACEALKRAGYRLALDDFVRRPAMEPLAELADIIKVDFLATSAEERRGLVKAFGRRGIQFVAEKVETRKDFAEAMEDGYTHFQGYFFCEPEVMSGSDIPAFKRNCLRFMQELNHKELDLDRLEDVIKHEMALAVKLLRYLNSAGFGWRHEVTSIRQALRVLGERSTRKWCSLMALTLLGDDKPAEQVVTALVRAQLCEQIGRTVGMANRDVDLFLVGMLSMLDSMLGRPLEDALAEMPVPQEIKDTLLGRPTALSKIYVLVRAYERADWEHLSELADEAGISVGRLPDLYRQSVQWVDRIFRS